jgi:flagellar basal-body rod protein FlgF
MSEISNLVGAIMGADVEALRVAANNVANAESTGYRRQIEVQHLDFSTVSAAHQQSMLHPPASSATPSTRSLLPPTQLAVDTRPGTLKNTAEPLDVAIQGDGYFVVDTPSGEMLTRRGDFHANESGVLSAYTGDAVLGVDGTIKLPSGIVQIAADGTVRVGSATVGQLRAVSVSPDSQLAERADGLLEVRAGEQPTASTAVQFHQGFLETSNVQPVQEMLHMMQIVRHFEAGQRYMRAYDQMLDKAINDLGQI